LIADTGLEAFMRSNTRGTVLVRTPDAEELAHRLRDADAAVRPGTEGALVVAGMESAEIGKIAMVHGVVLHELTPHRTSLEEAYLELTRDSVEFGVLEGARR
jgi:ABC-2 type transport system ATP-binding protein